MKKLYFLSGLPRSGSTVLAGILNQHPDIHASSTSGLLDMLVGTLRAWAESLSVRASMVDKEEQEKEIQRILRSICEEKYSHINKTIILDKARSWAAASNIPTMAKVLGHKPKIIATVRNIPDCVASMVRIAKPNNLQEFLHSSDLVDHIKKAYQVLESGHSFAPECILFVDYDDLVSDPKTQLEKIHKFLELPDFDGYDFNKIDGAGLQERDEEVWEVKGLHDIQPILAKQHTQKSEDVLGRHYRDFIQPRFWLGEGPSTRPIHELDLQLAAGIIGNFEEGNKIGEKLAIDEPWNNRAAFNRGWYEMWKGNLLEGHKLLYRGRLEKVFGNDTPQSPMPLWDGFSKGTVLLNLEGGLGDQIHSVRFAKEIASRGCEIIVACSGSVATLFRNITGVVAVIQHEAVFGVVHDFWVPSMSAPVFLDMEFNNVDGSPYITRPKIKSNKFRVGLRWQGNPNFEHQQHRIFPPGLLFDAVKNDNIEFISLQRDLGSEHRPNWVNEVPLNHWEETALVINSCDLIITSCTSVAHLAGAMGVPTWIIVPILPYYLWAKPGNKTEWYDSVTLYRQTTYGDWTNIFDEINKDINKLIPQKLSEDSINTI
jgi:hypothetical protein